MMDQEPGILGIDIGSMAVSAVLLSQKGKILDTFYQEHRGRISQCLENLENRWEPYAEPFIVLTSSGRIDIEGFPYVDIQTALIRAGQVSGPKPGYILHVGAERFYLIHLDHNGRYEHSRTNTSCAAGTGSFLDQQAKRLNISSIEEFCDLAGQNKDKVPDIASRCSVFAKTDLIHAQQEGYSLGAICDGLCKGLAKNVADTLFHDFPPGKNLLFTGGVSKNQVVRRHLEEMLECNLMVPGHSNVFGALGAAHRQLADKKTKPDGSLRNLIMHYKKDAAQLEYFYPPLELKYTEYPDFSKTRNWIHRCNMEGYTIDIQVEEFCGDENEYAPGLIIGIDIGSTSTKAVISKSDGTPLLGYYTYTSGRPVQATKAIFSALYQYLEERNLSPPVRGVGTTGSGRQLIGKIINADLIVDEITAHARAATHLDPETDTIIEIGGQDAKFTVLKNKEVVFSQMNSVCAAGTGSFIEELAKKLGVPLSDYSERVKGVESPLTSDRCTVFMERDLNYLVNHGYSVEELLCTTLFSVRENYLRKVATESMIGKHVCFQGATAKNEALVAAFEQKLDKAITVSRFCHLTGALGVSLILSENNPEKSGFRGLEIYKKHIPVRTEVCDLCNNNCKLTIAEVENEEVAYGFLCGRDYDTPKYVKQELSGFDLVKEWHNIFRKGTRYSGKERAEIGLPAGLHMFEELKFWEHLFNALDISVVCSRTDRDLVSLGKHLAGAEFCAPIESMFGHAISLAEQADYIFLPVYLESRERSESRERNFCYYTQFSPSIISQIEGLENRFIIPEVDFHFGIKHNKKAVYDALRARFGDRIEFNQVSQAWDGALEQNNRLSKRWKKRFHDNFSTTEEISVVLLGRPYIVLSQELNKKIPEYFNKKGIKCFFQDMIPRVENTGNGDILQRIPWHYASDVMKAADYIAGTENLYPVFITAFKCAPDSFILEYFKKILEAAEKPYLILQIDEHDSAVGYETRIEAALRSFHNHKRSGKKRAAHKSVNILPSLSTEIGDKTLLMPNWDPFTLRLVVAIMRRKGIDARLVESSDTNIRKSMAHNTGQCIPLNIIAQDFIEYVEHHDLDPSKTLLWMSDSWFTCNIRMYPEFLKTLLDNYGNGFEKAEVYLGNVSNLDLSLDASINTYLVYMLGGLIRKLGCRIRPYEVIPGTTDQVIDSSIVRLEKAFSGKRSLESTVSGVAENFNGIKTSQNGNRPEVAIFGDFYVRDHDIFNQELIRFIEQAGGEVITTPYNEYVKIIAGNVIRRMHKRGAHSKAILAKVLLTVMDKLDNKYYRQFESIVGAKERINPESLERHLNSFNVKPYHSGESYENLLKIFHILDYHPNLSMFVQTNPAFCCPALITEAMTRKIKSLTGVPIVTITYDGTSESKNEVILPYLVAASEK